MPSPTIEPHAAQIGETNGFAGLARQAELIAAGEATSRAVVDEALGAIERTQPTLNAFRVVRADAARTEADEADRRLAAGERLPLLGVPVAIKDDMDIAGESTSFGCEGEFPVAERDGWVAERLRAAGAIVVGKTNTPEIGQWSVTAGPAFGVTRNPWNLEHSPGGSSGGSASAVAAGIVAGAAGSDGAGSVRIPAGWTNLVGIKPQRGRVSSWPDPEAFNGITVIGPLARTVGDAALMLDVLSGNHPDDLHKVPPPAEPFAASAQRDPGKLRIAVNYKIPFSGVPTRLDPAVRAQIDRTADVLAGLGHEVAEVRLNYALVGLGFLPRSLAGVRDWARRAPDPSRLDPRTKHNVRNGDLVAPLLPFAREFEGVSRRAIGKVFREFDVVLMPTTAEPPFGADAINGLSDWETDKVIVGACPYAWAWNITGWPGVNVPAGFTAEGLPVGAQLLGQANSEPKLIALAAQLEDRERWHERRPNL
ncbi:MAG: amidase [Solirubrobacterales bacterium]